MFTVYVHTRSLVLVAIEARTTERAAREFINGMADGTYVFTLVDSSGNRIVRTSWPVLMVA
jgi:hypothetical protein